MSKAGVYIEHAIRSRSNVDNITFDKHMNQRDYDAAVQVTLLDSIASSTIAIALLLKDQAKYSETY
jgi:hypothetical protein